MTRLQVTCIKRGSHYDPHDRITHIGGGNNGTRWKFTVDEAIKSIEDGKQEFYVSVNSRFVDIIIATHGNRKYLKTTADEVSANNLLSLPECP